jgi:hypothetical protein
LKDKAFGKKKIIDRKNEVFTLSLRGFFQSLRGSGATEAISDLRSDLNGEEAKDRR